MLIPRIHFQVKLWGITGLVDFDNNTRSRLVERLDIINVQVRGDDDGNTESALVNVSPFNNCVVSVLP